MSKICMFTGHRKIEPRHAQNLSQRLDLLLEGLIEEGYTEFCAGGAVGFDTVAALKVIEKKKKYGFVKLHLYLPCHDQDRSWSYNMKRAYNYVLENADTIRYACETYTRGCMQQRNRAMVDDSEACIAYCGSSSGGTFYTVSLANQKGIKVINLYE